MEFHPTPNRKINCNGSLESVEFIVIHYTVEDLESTFDIFSDPTIGVSSHFVIAEDGLVYSLLDCLSDSPVSARHTGESYYMDRTGNYWSNFNKISIGIEMVNRNGNIIPYNKEQYESLFKVIFILKSKYSSLHDPERIIGHEHIAGWRGKVDPGYLFDWNLLFRTLYPNFDIPNREGACPFLVRKMLGKFLDCIPSENASANIYWRNINLLLETYTRLLNEAHNGFQL